MHVVECPGCHARFNCPTAGANLKLKCGKCGLSFVGSTREPDQQPAPADAVVEQDWLTTTPSTRPVVRRVRSRASNGPLLILGALVGVGVVVVAIVAMTRDDGAANNRLANARKDPPPAASPATPTNPATPRPPVAHVRPTPARFTPVTMPVETAPAELTPESGPVASRPAIPESDPNLILNPHDLAGSPGSTYIAGSLSNRTGKALKSVTVNCYFEDGTPLKHGRSTYMYIPAGAVVYYTIPAPYEDLKVEEIKVVATCKDLEDGAVVWELGPQDLRRSSTGQNTWTGSVTNPGDIPLKDVKVYVECYDDKWVQTRAAAVGEAELNNPSKSLPGKGNANFKIVLDGDQSNMMIRAVGWKYKSSE